MWPRLVFFLPKMKPTCTLRCWRIGRRMLLKGSVTGGYVAYLQVELLVTNESTDTSIAVQLAPHVNLSDNLHYAQNIKLPGKIDDKYTLKFIIEPPMNGSLGLHYDWREQVGEKFTPGGNFTFEGLDFSKIAKTTRR